MRKRGVYVSEVIKNGGYCPNGVYGGGIDNYFSLKILVM